MSEHDKKNDFNLTVTQLINGQLKPGYTWQIPTENQYILGYTIHQTTNDTTTLQAPMESLNDNLGKMPSVLLADAGNGS